MITQRTPPFQPCMRPSYEARKHTQHDLPSLPVHECARSWPSFDFWRIWSLTTISTTLWYIFTPALPMIDPAAGSSTCQYFHIKHEQTARSQRKFPSMHFNCPNPIIGTKFNECRLYPYHICNAPRSHCMPCTTAIQGKVKNKYTKLYITIEKYNRLYGYSEYQCCSNIVNNVQECFKGITNWLGAYRVCVLPHYLYQINSYHPQYLY